MRIVDPELGRATPAVSTVRLYLMRAAYLIITFGLMLMIWPLLLNETDGVEHMRGVVWSVLAAVSLLAVLGVRYPLQMLPLLLFELIWKTIWLVAIGLPQRLAGTMGPGEAATWLDCLVGVALCVIAIPWGYVFSHYVRRRGEPWRRDRTVEVAPAR